MLREEDSFSLLSEAQRPDPSVTRLGQLRQGRQCQTTGPKTGGSRDDAVAALVKSNPQGRLIEPEEVASAVMFLCSDAAQTITGQAIAVSGGEC